MPQTLQSILDAGENSVDRLFRNPPKNALTVYPQMMPGDAVRPQFTGTEVMLIWGEEGGGRRSSPWIDPNVQMKVRATVAPCPISQATQAYRKVPG